MSGTVRNQATLLTASADNATNNYTNQNQRDFIVSVFNIVPAVVSAAGTTQGTATPLTAQNNVITICTAGAGVVATLPFHKIYSRGANPVLFYPISGAQFEGLAVNAPVSIPVGTTVEMAMTSTTQGYVG